MSKPGETDVLLFWSQSGAILRQSLTGNLGGRQRPEPEQQWVLMLSRFSSPGVIAFAAPPVWPAPIPSARRFREP